MANKEFQVRHGLVVGNNVLVANVTTNTVDVLGTITANVIQVGGSTIPSGAVSNLVYTTANAAFGVANLSANNLANTSIAANNYAGAMANSSNGYAVTVGLSGNAYADVVGTSANAYAVSVTISALTNNVYPSITSANNYAGAMANSANDFAYTGYTNVSFVLSSNMANNALSANNYAGAMANSGNVFTGTVYTAVNSAFGVINAAFGQANTLATSANAYATVVGTSSNNYLGSLVNSAAAIAVGAFGVANNAYTATNGAASFALTNTTYAAVNSAFAVINAAFGQANTLKTSANAYADLVGTSANNYAGRMANSANSYAASLTPDLSPAFSKANTAYTVANGAFDKANAVATGANAYATAVGTAGNTYAATVGTNANNYSNATFLKLTAASQTITGDFSISGNLFIGGNTTSVSANNFIVNDPLIYLANGNPSDIIDIGFIGSYINGTSAYVHTGLYREHTDKEYYLFQGYDADPINNHIGALSNNMTLSVLNANIRTSNLNLGGANAITWIRSGFGVANAAYGQANTLATSANAYAAAVGVSVNAYAVTVGTSGNAFATAVGTAGNAYAVTVGTSGNNYAATVGTSSNNFAGVMANSVNTYTTATYSTLTQLGQNWAVTNAAFGVANSAYTATNGAAAFAFANGVATNATAAFAAANAEFTFSNTIYAAVNSAFGVINAAYTSSNADYVLTNAAFTVANAAFGKANSAYTATNGSAAFAFANGVATNTTAAFAASNAEFTFSNTIYAAVNSAFAVINAAYTSSNADYVVSNAAFARGNTSAQLAFFRVAANGSNLDAVSNADTLTVRSSNNIILIANSTNDSIQITQNPSGVTATTYGGSTNIPVIVVDAFGRITSAANQSFSAGGVTSVSGTAGRITSSGGSTPAIDLATAGAGAASYSSGISAITVDAYGRVTAVTGSAGYLTGITSGQVTTALGFTPYNATNPSGYITSSALSPYAPLAGATFTGLITGRVPTTSGVGGGNDAGSMSIRGDGSKSAHISFHRAGAYAINMGLDTDNVFRIGGWSDGATTYRLQLATPGGTSTLNGTLTATTDMRAPIFYDSNDTTVRFDGGILVLRSTSPTIYFRDTDHNSAMLHNNSNLLYILRGGNDTESWSQVGGQWPFYINLTNNGATFGAAISAVGNVTAYASDKRLKENIKEIPDAIEKIKKIRGVTFDWNDLSEQQGFTPDRKYDDVGVIAQEIQEVLPNVVTLAPFDIWIPDPGVNYSDKELTEKSGTSKSGNNYLTVQYEKIVPLLIQAIKELQDQIDDLKTK